MGKSLYIQRLVARLAKKLNQPQAAVHHIIPIHGPDVNPDTVMKFFEDHLKKQSCNSCIYHIDIAPNVRLNPSSKHC